MSAIMGEVNIVAIRDIKHDNNSHQGHKKGNNSPRNVASG